jgi:hypothetical protein
MSNELIDVVLDGDFLNEKFVEWRYDLVEDVYVIIKAPQLRIHIRKYFVPNGEWTLDPYLPPPRGTLTGMFNAWVWSFALRDISKEV